jgi:RNA polymerase sigma factor (sigma-70 family)
MMGPVSDEELLAQYRAQKDDPGSGAFLDELFARHHKRVAVWCLRFTQDREAAADLAQEVFVKALRGLDSYRGECRFSTWLFSIARNHCFSEIKARSSRPQEADEETLGELRDLSPDAYHRLERESSDRLLRELLMSSALTDLETQVMTLHYGEELPLDAVASMLRLENQSGAKAYIVSAKRKLARAVQRWKAGKGAV